MTAGIRVTVTSTSFAELDAHWARVRADERARKALDRAERDLVAAERVLRDVSRTGTEDEYWKARRARNRVERAWQRARSAVPR